MELAFFDWLVLFIYLAIIASIGLYVSRGQRTVRKFFTADRSIPSWAVGFTLMATIVGSGTFVGHPGTAYGKGMILFLPHMLLPLVLLIVAVWIVPFYRRVVQMSAYEFVGRRFGLGSRIYTSLGFLADRTFALGVTLVTTGIALYVFTGWEPMYVILGTGLFTLIYTMIGGSTAVAWTNVAQGIILSGGAALILIRVLFAPEIGDPVGIIKSSWEAGRYSFGSWEFSWRMLFDRETTTIWIFFFAYFIQWSRRYITDQHIVQNYLIGESDEAASRGALMGAFCCLPIFFAFMFIGGSFYGFFDLMPGDAGPVKADEVMPYFLSRYIPAGVLGLILAAILAAAMSSVSADLNSIATVLTTDYFGNIFPNVKERTRLICGRLFVMLGGLSASAIAILLLPKDGSVPLMERAITIATIISGGTLGLFCLGFLTRRATRTGVYYGIGACVKFTSWALLSKPDGAGGRIVDFGFNWEMNSMLIGLFGHFILFGVGYLTSRLLGGYRPANVEELTIHQVAKLRRAGKAEKAGGS
ncbi:MAG: sodium/solute symporter [Opitutae bacterium]|nr:sodium/solute symporter [Opitutae bacterium]